MDHAKILADLGDGVKPTGYQVLCALYKRPEKTKGGIILAEVSRKEDEYQGRIGLVLAVGPDAYSDKARFPSEPWCKAGDYVLVSNYANQPGKFKYGDHVLFYIADDEAKIVVADPYKVS